MGLKRIRGVSLLSADVHIITHCFMGLGIPILGRAVRMGQCGGWL